MAARKKVPSAEQEAKELPSTEVKTKKLPQIGNPENSVMIGGKPVEIKATKVKYQRNRTAAFYKI